MLFKEAVTRTVSALAGTVLMLPFARKIAPSTSKTLVCARELLIGTLYFALPILPQPLMWRCDDNVTICGSLLRIDGRRAGQERKAKGRSQKIFTNHRNLLCCSMRAS